MRFTSIKLRTTRGAVAEIKLPNRTDYIVARMPNGFSFAEVAETLTKAAEFLKTQPPDFNKETNSYNFKCGDCKFCQMQMIDPPCCDCVNKSEFKPKIVVHFANYGI